MRTAAAGDTRASNTCCHLRATYFEFKVIIHANITIDFNTDTPLCDLRPNRELSLHCKWRSPVIGQTQTRSSDSPVLQQQTQRHSIRQRLFLGAIMKKILGSISSSHMPSRLDTLAAGNSVKNRATANLSSSLAKWMPRHTVRRQVSHPFTHAER